MVELTALFPTFLGLGFRHITDPNGIDHILFVASLCLSYSLKQWRSVLFLVTAFTLGHSVTLVLAALEVVKIDASRIEFLIALSILLSAVYNILSALFGRLQAVSLRSGPAPRVAPLADRSAPRGFLASLALAPPAGAVMAHYSMAFLFGLVHGLGFSNYLRAILPEHNKLLPALLAFNIGLEFGQIIIVLCVLLLGVLGLAAGFSQRYWVVFCSLGIGVASIFMLIDRI